jgi:hypothetical protein
MFLINFHLLVIVYMCSCNRPANACAKQDLLDYEKINNSLLVTLTQQKGNDKYAQYAPVRKILVERRGTILLPQSVCLSDIDITPVFVNSHIAICNANNNDQFITLNGLYGVFDEKHESVAVLGFVPDQARFTAEDAKPGSFPHLEHRLFFVVVQLSWQIHQCSEHWRPNLLRLEIPTLQRNTLLTCQVRRLHGCDRRCCGTMHRTCAVVDTTYYEVEAGGRGTVVPLVVLSLPVIYPGCEWFGKHADDASAPLSRAVFSSVKKCEATVSLAPC